MIWQGKVSHPSIDTMCMYTDEHVLRDGSEPSTRRLGVVVTGRTHVGYVRIRVLYPESKRDKT